LLRLAGVALGGGALTGIGCRRPEATGATAALADLAARYATLTLRLARQQPSLVEQWLGPAEAAAVPRVPVPVLQAEAVDLLGAVTTLLASDRWQRHRDKVTAATLTSPHLATDLDRAAYLAGQVRALEAAAGRLLGDSQSFRDDAVRTFGRAMPRRDAARLEAVRQDLALLLPGPGSLAERHAAFRRAAAVPPDRVEAVFAAAVDWCRTATRRHLPLPDGETLAITAEDAAGWAAFSRPTGTRSSAVWVARRGGADAAHLLQLAAHEGAPGHHAQHVLAAATLVDGLGWQERRLHPGFGPHRLYAEGAAEAGTDLLLPEAVRIGLCAEQLLPAAGLPVALAEPLVRIERRAAALDIEVAHITADYLDTSLGSAAAADRLRDEALVLDPAGMLAFAEKQRLYLLAYPLGRSLVTAALGAGDEPSRWHHLATIATTLTLAGAPGE